VQFERNQRKLDLHDWIQCHIGLFASGLFVRFVRDDYLQAEAARFVVWQKD
jgi:hypothetical protein